MTDTTNPTPPLVCETCGHVNWEPLASRLDQAIARRRLTEIWVPCEVREYMKYRDSLRSSLFAVTAATAFKLLYRGVEVKGLTRAEEYPTPNVPGEMYLIVKHNGSFLYMWME